VKRCPVKDQEAVRQWADRRECCQVCGIDEHNARWVQITGLQTHHIIKAGHSDEACNLLRVCERCHRIIEGESVPGENGSCWPHLTLAHVLYCKQEHDPQQYDPDRLTVLWRNRQRTRDFDPLPAPEPLPDMYTAERMQWLIA
jgi:RNA polymerase subunit RPABC4/transcription elongation factor Spt4